MAGDKARSEHAERVPFPRAKSRHSSRFPIFFPLAREGTEPYVQSAAVTSRMMMVKNKEGRPRFEPTEEQRKNVEIMVRVTGSEFHNGASVGACRSSGRVRPRMGKRDKWVLRNRCLLRVDSR